MTCLICALHPGQPTKLARNGLPKGVVCCPACLEAWRRAEVAVASGKDGSLSIADGRQ